MPTFHISELRERASYDYIFIDPDNNEVHLMVPLVGGETVGIDNTCQSAREIKQFFGMDQDAGVRAQSAIHVLARLKADLESDITLLSRNESHERLRTEKEARLHQVNRYIIALSEVTRSQQVTRLGSWLADYPEPVHAILGDRTNCFSMLLSPVHEDNWTRTRDPLFSVARTSGRDGQFPGQFGPTLRRTIRTSAIIVANKSPKDSISEKIALEHPNATVEELVRFLRDEIILRYPSLEGSIDLVEVYGQAGTVISEDYLKTIMGYEPGEVMPVDESIDNIFQFSLSPNFWDTLPETAIPSPFVQLGSNKEHLSIMTQFFLAKLNFHAHVCGLSTLNFGAVIDDDRILCNNLVSEVLHALEAGRSVEAALFNFVNAHGQAFALSDSLPTDILPTLCREFTQQYLTIKDLAEKDEFIIHVPEHEGSFAIHQGKIAFSFAEFITRGFQATTNIAFFETMQEHFKANRTRLLQDGKLPHKHDVPTVDIELDDASIIRMLRERQDRGLSAILLMKTEDDRRVYERLSDDTITLLVKNSKWPDMKRECSRSIDVEAELRHFRAHFARLERATPHVFMRMTGEQIRCLYTEVEERFGPTALLGKSDVGHARLHAAFDLLGLKAFEISSSHHDGYFVSCAPDTERSVREIAVRQLRTIHLTQEMASSLYKEVTQRFGEFSSEVRRMNSLFNKNQAAKIIYVLGTLGMSDITYTNNRAPVDANQDKPSIRYNNFKGYKLNAQPHWINRIRDINRSHTEQSLQITPEMVEKLYQGLANHFGDRSPEVLEITLLDDNPQQKLERALQLMVVRHESLLDLGDGSFYLSLRRREAERAIQLMSISDPALVHSPAGPAADASTPTGGSLRLFTTQATMHAYNLGRMNHSLGGGSTGICTTMAKRLASVMYAAPDKSYYSDLSHCPRVDLTQSGLTFEFGRDLGGLTAASRFKNALREQSDLQIEAQVENVAGGKARIVIRHEDVKKVMAIFFKFSRFNILSQGIDPVVAKIYESRKIDPGLQLGNPDRQFGS